jgi:HSP20 family protein
VPESTKPVHLEKYLLALPLLYTSSKCIDIMSLTTTRRTTMTNPIEKLMDNKALNPFRELTAMQDSFDRFLSEVLDLKRLKKMDEFRFSPSCEITEEAGKIVLKVDVPGVKKENVKVEIDNDLLTISAVREEEKKQETKKKYVSELNYGSYNRTFALPGPVDEKKIEAKFENGVLTVIVPKTESQKMKQIPVN